MILEHISYDLTNKNTFGMKVSCDQHIEFDSPYDLSEIGNHLLQKKPWMVMGAGSNLLFTHDFHGAVVHCGIRGIDIVDETPEEVIVRAGAGVALDDFASWASEHGYWGVENLSGIPGEVGAAAVQNVGAYGVEACDIIHRIHAFDVALGTTHAIKPEDCDYGYRSSKFKSQWHNRYIITAVDFCLSKDPEPRLDYPALKKAFQDHEPATPQEVRQTVIEIRNAKLPDPKAVPNAGSFFRNPIVDVATFHKIKNEHPLTDVPHYDLPEGKVKIPAAWLIEQCDWKGRRLGNAAVWHLQPLVLVNPDGDATPEDILKLEQEIIKSVERKFGITLQPEVEHI